ncbi:MAG: serine hydrolase domain-containing protein, partial [Thermoguttaceae bacterium]
HEGEVHFFGFGQISENDPQTPDEKTVYEIASITKLFTGVLLADMLERSEVSLDDKLSDLLPNGVTLPQKGEAPITLLDIATHRSGLPRLAPHFWETANKTPGDPYTLFTVEKIYDSLAQWKPEVEPQNRYEYSNYGYAILGNVIANKFGVTFEDLLRDRVLTPLGMNETQVKLSDELVKRLAQPHDAEHKPCKNWDLAGFAPGGGLRSTVSDMVRFAAAALGQMELVEKLNSQRDAEAQTNSLDATESDKNKPQLEQLKKDFELAQKIQADGMPGRKIGLGWNYNPHRDFYWHNGQTGGYFSMLLVDRKHGNAVVILSNSFNDAPDSLAVKIIEALKNADETQ